MNSRPALLIGVIVGLIGVVVGLYYAVGESESEVSWSDGSRNTREPAVGTDDVRPLTVEPNGSSVELSSTQTTVPGAVSDETPSPSSGSAPESVRNFGRELALYLDGFVGEQPDLLGWTEYLSQLAIDAQLDLESVHSDEAGTHGVLVLPGSELTMNVSLLESGYSVKLESMVTLHSGDTVPFTSTLSAPVEDGGVERVFGVVQFSPSGESVFDDNPIGYVYEMKDGSSSARPMNAVYEGGQVSVRVESKTESRATPFGSVAQPYRLMLRLQELSASDGE